MAYSDTSLTGGVVRSVLRTVMRSFDPSGRARRIEGGRYFVATWLVSLAANLVGTAFTDDIFTLQRATQLVLAIPYCALLARRLHDQGRKAWPALLLPPALALGIPDVVQGVGLDFEARIRFQLTSHPLSLVAGALGLACLLLFLREGNVGPNAYGPDPRDDPADH
jgi:uncharacterized membrane protein YhaH (DUF805 family)